MLRLIKALTLTGLSSVYLMQIDSTTTEHGFSVFSSVWGTVEGWLVPFLPTT